jgi:hypothetical protein
MSVTEPVKPLSVIWWWECRRPLYNLLVVAGGVVGWLLLSTSIWLTQPFLPSDDAGEVTLFTVIFQGLLFALGLIAANVCYTAGWVSELVLRPKARRPYRRWAYGLGTGLSLALVLCLPVMSALSAATLLVSKLV